MADLPVSRIHPPQSLIRTTWGHASGLMWSWLGLIRQYQEYLGREEGEIIVCSLPGTEHDEHYL